jgi:glutamine amidotransferase
VVSHIRQANRGQVNLENTHPFTRELWGRYWTFAHNGQLSNYHNLDTGHFRPVGETDSELSFCWLLKQLDQRFPEPPQDMEAMFAYVAECCDKLRELGVYNMLLSDGEYVMTYCTNHLYWITRKAPFGKASLLDEDVTINFQEETTPNDVVSVVATQPLTGNETWHRMKPGEYNLFHFGELAASNVDELGDVAFAEAKPKSQAPTEPL